MGINISKVILAKRLYNLLMQKNNVIVYYWDGVQSSEEMW